jgi:hypothetical protein
MQRKRAIIELVILEQKLKALNTLMKYEQDVEKLRRYENEVHLVASELEDYRRQISNQMQKSARASA